MCERVACERFKLYHRFCGDYTREIQGFVPEGCVDIVSFLE